MGDPKTTPLMTEQMAEALGYAKHLLPAEMDDHAGDLVQRALLQRDAELTAALERAMKAEAALQRAVDHIDMAADLYTSDADLIAGVTGILRAALNPTPSEG